MYIDKEKIERTRRRIIDAANELLKKIGLSGTNMSQIAKAAKVARSTIYNYFHSREEIFADAIRRELKKVHDAFAEVLSEDTAEEMLKKYFRVRQEVLREFSELYHKSREEIEAILPEIKDEYEKLREFERELIKEILKYGAESGEFIVKDIDSLAETIDKFLVGFEKLVIEKGIHKEEVKKDYENFRSVLLSAVRNGVQVSTV